MWKLLLGRIYKLHDPAGPRPSGPGSVAGLRTPGPTTHHHPIHSTIIISRAPLEWLVETLYDIGHRFDDSRVRAQSRCRNPWTTTSPCASRAGNEQGHYQCVE